MKIHPYSSPNFDDRKGVVEFIILHYTGMKTAQEAIDNLVNPESGVSAHYTIDEDGTVYSHVEEDKRAWHAGKSYWRGQRDLNSVSVGVEIVNPGHEFGYQPLEDAQIKTVIELCQDIMKRYDIVPENILGHADIAPERKQDPGELFPWKRLANNGVGIWPEPAEEDVVKGSGLVLETALNDFGYDPDASFEANLLAFQRHFVPEAFQEGREGYSTSLTKTRLYALLAGHLHIS